MLTLVAVLLAAAVATLALGLCKAAGRARPTPPPLHHEMRLTTAMHEEVDRAIREHER